MRETVRAFVSYNTDDGARIQPIISFLKDFGFEVATSLDQRLSKVALTKTAHLDALNKEIAASSLLVIASSKKYESTSVNQAQSQSIRLHKDISGEADLIIVNLDSQPLPSAYWQYNIVHANRDYEGGLSFFRKVVNDLFISEEVDETSSPDEESINTSHLEELASEFRNRNLTVVCGAGISIDAGLPDWSELLDRLLVRTIESLDIPVAKDTESRELEDFKKSSSSLIIGRYFKSILKGDFLNTVRDQLYATAGKPSSIIDEIVELATPSRTGATLDSIVTFNFDGLIEEALSNRKLPHKAIFSEGQRCEPSEIGVYHVHGYLPRKGKIHSDTPIVFSEDAYHDQFSDPFSWANLIQLAKYGQTTCLFVGLSLTDPNLRRLLDVSNRRQSHNSKRHFIIQVESDSNSKSRLLESLKSNDASELGLTTIKLSDFSNIAPFLAQIKEVENS